MQAILRTGVFGGISLGQSHTGSVPTQSVTFKQQRMNAAALQQFDLSICRWVQDLRWALITSYDYSPRRNRSFFHKAKRDGVQPLAAKPLAF